MRLVVLALGLMIAGCRAAHEGLVRQRIVQEQLEQTLLPLTLFELDQRMLALPRDRGDRRCAELCLSSAKSTVDRRREYCVVRRDFAGCLTARSDGDGTRIAAPAGRVLQPSLVAAVWRLADEAGLQAAAARLEDDVAAIVAEEESSFTPRPSFTVGARSGAIISFDTTAFSFGGHAGARVWLSYFIVGTGGVDVETALISGRSIFTLAPLLRAELALWRVENLRWVNLPELSFTMTAEPVIAFGTRPAVGGRGAVGISLVHLAGFWTPFFFEVGFQALSVDGTNVSGLRLTLGVGL